MLAVIYKLNYTKADGDQCQWITNNINLCYWLKSDNITEEKSSGSVSIVQSAPNGPTSKINVKKHYILESE